MAATAIDLLVVVWLGTVVVSVQEPVVLTVAPKHVRFLQNTTLMCSAAGVEGGGLNVTLKVRDESSTRPFFNQTLFFQKDGIQSVTFNMTAADVSPTSKSLVLEAQGPWTREDIIPIQRDTGYIMVQTDKPVYTPSQTVKYRVVALDEDLAWAPWTVQVEVVSPSGIIVDQIPSLDAKTAFNTHEFRLHEHGMLGRWQVRASFQQEVQLTTSAAATFDVDEYVLPTFSVKTVVRPSAITQDTRQIRVIMTATYVFGERIRGEGQLRLGVKQGDVVQRHTDKVYRVKFKSGRAAISIKTRDLASLPLWCSDRVSHLYIEANVTESGYGEMQTVYHVTTPVSKDALRVTFPRDQLYFLSSRPFLFRGILSYASGLPAAGVKVKVTMKETSHEVPTLKAKRLTTNAAGEFGFTHIMPDVDRVSFQVETVDRRYSTQTHADHTAQALTPGKPRITLQADVPQDSGEDIAVHVGYTSSVNDSIMTIIVEARGQTIFSHSLMMMGTDLHTVHIPASYRAELSPSANVLAFFTTQGETVPEVIYNTMTLDVPDVCLEEITLRKYNQNKIYRPGFNTRFRIDGANNTRVGLVAVDQSVYLLAGRSSLSRQEMFQTLMGHSLASTPKSHRDIFTQTWTVNGFVLRFLDTSGIPFFDGFARRNGLSGNIMASLPANPEAQKNVETVKFVVRQNFSETWLFEDILLSRRILRDGRAIMYLNWTLPDSLTTWRMHAVGVSSRRGLCVSEAVDFTVSKEFFVDIHMPYKVVRLETIKVKFSVFNFKSKSIKVTVTVTVPEELCIVREAGQDDENDEKRGGRTLRYTERIRPKSGAWHDYTFVSLKPGHHHIRAVARAGRVTDTVQKDMYVVPEGRRVSQTVTFQLDPSALLLHNDTGPAVDNMAATQQGERITSSWSKLEDEQMTVVDLALPLDTISGTSHTNMFAYGDLMGDVVSGAVVQTESLMEETAVLGGRRVLGDLAPAVTALRYLQRQGVITHDLETKGKQFVKQGVSQLLNYRHPRGGFLLLEGQPPATWFTAAVLQTLCVVKEMNFTYIDQTLIDNGAQWLLERVGDGDEIEMTEESPRHTGNREADDVATLVAEVLLSILQCEKHIENTEFQAVSEMLKVQLWAFLEERLDNISSSLALTKVSLALTKVNSEYAHVAVRNVINIRRNSSQGFYWSNTHPEEEESPMFRGQVEALSVEATSFALMTFLHSGTWSDVTPVANWLVQNRGRHGVFVGMMDTMAATDALAMYSHRRQSPNSDLHCNITSHQSNTYHQTIDFSQEEAVVKKGVSGAPSGEVYQFDSRGSRLGQMQIETTYNVAVGKNDHCAYNLSVSSKPFDISNTGTTLCKQCGFACTHDAAGETSRRKRSAVASASIMCIEVCLTSFRNTTSHNVRVDTGLPSGHKMIPVTQAEMAVMTRRKTMFQYKDGLFSVMLDKVSEGEKICFGFRAVDKQEVAHHQPSIVTIREDGQKDPSCSQAYDAKDSSVTLPVLCSNLSQRHKGVCICASGTCGKCRPRRGMRMRTKHVKRELCGTDYVYKVETRGTEEEGAWRHTKTTVVETHIQGRDRIRVGQTLTFSTPGYCAVCPNYRVGQPLYVLGKDGDRLMDDSGTVIFRHVVDDSVVFLNVTTTRIKRRGSAVKESFVKRAIKNYKARGCPGSK